MPPSSATRRQHPVACSINLVALRTDGRSLHVLLHRARSTWHVPATVLGASGSLDDAALALAGGVLGARPWLEQAGASATGGHSGRGLAVTFAAVTSNDAVPGADAAWKRVSELPSELTPGDRAAIKAAVAHVRTRVEHTPVAFRLLPATFTLGDLQGAYELLLGRSLHKASFRRTLAAAALVQPTKASRREGRGRPALLYQFAPRRRRPVQRGVHFDLL